MPWHVAKSSKCPPSKPWAVIKDATGAVVACHASKADAQAQVAALYANEPGAAMSASADCGCENSSAARSHLEAHMQSIHAQAGAVEPQGIRDYAAAAEQRAQAAQDSRLAPVPAAAGRRLPVEPNLEVRGKVQREGQEYFHLHGTASVYEKPYEMWDVFGPYHEIVSRAAGSASLGRNPDVAFKANHEGLSLARTTNGTLILVELDAGLDYDAFLNPKRYDVSDLVTAVDDRTIDESSFAFMIERGSWNDDFTQYRIDEYEINRGDVSAVNYGASPWTSVAARQQIFLADLDRAPAFMARAAFQRLQHRPDLVIPEPEPKGRSVAIEVALLQLDES